MQRAIRDWWCYLHWHWWRLALFCQSLLLWGYGIAKRQSKKDNRSKQRRLVRKISSDAWRKDSFTLCKFELVFIHFCTSIHFLTSWLRAFFLPESLATFWAYFFQRKRRESLRHTIHTVHAYLLKEFSQALFGSIAFLTFWSLIHIFFMLQISLVFFHLESKGHCIGLKLMSVRP